MNRSEDIPIPIVPLYRKFNIVNCELKVVRIQMTIKKEFVLLD